MYVPKDDPDSIDDKDIMGFYIGPGLGMDLSGIY
jgi:hypothetical protein